MRRVLDASEALLRGGPEAARAGGVAGEAARGLREKAVPTDRDAPSRFEGEAVSASRAVQAPVRAGEAPSTALQAAQALDVSKSPLRTTLPALGTEKKETSSARQALIHYLTET